MKAKKQWVVVSLVVCLLAYLVCAGGAVAQQQGSSQPSASPLVRVLQAKGILTAEEVAQLNQASSANEAEQHLAKLLLSKGIISESDYNQMMASSGFVNAGNATPSSSNMIQAVYRGPSGVAPGAAPASAVVGGANAAPVPDTPPGPTVVAAIAPLRVLPVDPPKQEGLIPGIKLGPITMRPYGFIKATGVYDSSSPNGDDFPFPGLFLNTPNPVSTGPTIDSEFHLKARSSRIGSAFEWPGVTKKMTITGKIEGDFEGNFSEVDNRDVSSIRSNSFQLRLAYGRIDYKASDNTDLFFKAGQDWTLFGSNMLPNLLETTFLGAYSGTIYERSPQFTIGMVQTLSSEHNIKLLPEFGIMMPSSGMILKLGTNPAVGGLAAQLGEGEREGADSGEPEIEARLVLQFQLDPAPAVPPAQILWAGFYGRDRQLAETPVPLPADATLAQIAAWSAAAGAYPHGFTTSNPMYGNQVGIQLPTRWFTLDATGYFGGDLRFMFGGQLNTFYTDMNPFCPGGVQVSCTAIGVPFYTIDGGPMAAAGSAAVANGLVAPQRAIRAFGGYIELGLPVSRWFNVKPESHWAGWQVYFDFGKDQVVGKDLAKANYAVNPLNAEVNVLSPLPLRMGKRGVVTVYYKMNNWVTFGFEQSVYGYRLVKGGDYMLAGLPGNEWQDHRTEFGPIFNF